MSDQKPLPRLDRPIKRISDDLLVRKPFALLVANALLEDNQEGATVVGISGAWGTGKSSVAEMIVEIAESEVSVVRFDPWMVSTRESLVTEFFNVLGGAAFPNSDKPKDKGERARFYKYASKSLGVLSVVGNAAGTLIPGANLATKAVESAGKVLEAASQGLEAMANEPTIREARDKISDDLRKLSKPIMVVIDDIDRLDRNEVRVTLQLVKSIADFPNIRYLLLYDREQIVDALSSFVHSPDAFLEKIINQAFDLPEATAKQRTELLDDYLGELNLHEDLPRKTMERLSRIFTNVLLPGLPTLRHIKRYVATVRALLPGVVKDGHRNIDPADFLALEFVRQYAPGVYKTLREQDGPVTGGKYARLWEPEKWAEEIEIQRNTAVQAIQSENLQALVKHAVASLGRESSDSDSATDFMNRRFSSESWRPVYFGFDESRASVSQSRWTDFLVCLSKPDKAQSWLNDWSDQDRRREWVSAITSRAAEIPWDESLTLISLLFQWGDTQEQEDTNIDNLTRTWRFSVRFCVDAIMSVTPDDLNPIDEMMRIVKRSGSVVSAGFCVGTEMAREEKGTYDRWARDYDLKPLIHLLRKKLKELMEDDTIWKLPDVDAAISACHYVVDKKSYQTWWSSVSSTEERLINYIEKDLAKAPTFNYRFEEGPFLEALRNLDESKLSEKGRETRLLAIASARDIFDRDRFPRRPLLT